MAYESVKNSMKRNMFVRLLATVVAATQSGQVAYLDEKKASELGAADPSLIEVNPTLKNDKGEVAVRATAAGLAAGATATPAAPKAPKADPSTFQIESGITMPQIQRGARPGTESYPFSKLEVNQSFLIPATTERPNPAKSLASTVSAASRRYAKRDANGKVVSYDRKFAIREVEGGARVWRTQ